ncbi:MAG: hypothetical protein R2820_13085 [Cyclobacteriaceae bacterium]|nr:hypothetical protein [Cyclobacteriaceae bacterium]
MKKLAYTLLFSLIVSFAMSSCTDESISPKGGGGAGSEDNCGGNGCS